MALNSLFCLEILSGKIKSYEKTYSSQMRAIPYLCFPITNITERLCFYLSQYEKNGDMLTSLAYFIVAPLPDPATFHK